MSDSWFMYVEKHLLWDINLLNGFLISDWLPADQFSDSPKTKRLKGILKLKKKIKINYTCKDKRVVFCNGWKRSFAINRRIMCEIYIQKK